MQDWFMYFIIFWAVIMLIFMTIGGYFMFRKFLKIMPLGDGKSKLDWQNHWVEASRHMWTAEAKEFLALLVSPVPQAFRDIASHSIAARIGQVAIESGASQVTKEHCIEGYIRATPKRDYRSLISFLNKNNIDYSRYEHLINK